MKAGTDRGEQYGRKAEFDVEKTLASIRKGLTVSEAAERAGVDRRNVFYHVKKDKALMALLAKRKKQRKEG